MSNVVDVVANKHSRERILDLAIAAIDEGGEVAIRVNDLAAAAGVTVPTLYRHFGSRDGLIVAAQTQRFRLTQNSDTSILSVALARAKTAEQFQKTLRKELLLHFERDRWVLRATRLNTLGSAVKRPDLQASIAQAQREGAMGIAMALEPYQRKGWLRPDVDLLALAYWYMGQILGRALIEMGDDPVVEKHWNQISIEAVVVAAFGPPAQR
ncbi:MAG: TetR/AcrR family transcriptional regulator [Actinobacteria bacterium]|nr:TetR/AcrR family transcriptional regulator [Actinomycetota bacterium]